MQATPSSLQVYYTVVPADEKLNQLVAFLRTTITTARKIMVYMCTCACVSYYAKVLPQLPGLKGVSFVALHGKVAAKVRCCPR